MAITLSVLARRLGLTAPLLLVAACSGGGGGGGDIAASASSLGGVVVDGYLKGARVFLDVDKDGIQDADEPSTQTDTYGRYTLNLGSRSKAMVAGLPIIAEGGIDTDTGFIFGGQLVASVDPDSDSQVLTPFMTLVHEQLEQGLAGNIKEARDNVASALGLAGGGDVLKLDPVLAVSSRPDLYEKQVALQRAIEALASAENDIEDSEHEAQERVAKGLAKRIHELAKAGQSVGDIGALISSIYTSDLKNAPTVNQAKTNVAYLASKTEAAVRAALGGVSLQGLSGDALMAAIKLSSGKVLAPLDQLKVKLEREIERDSDNQKTLRQLADETETEHGDRGLRDLLDADDDDDKVFAAVDKMKKYTTPGGTVVIAQPADTTGRLLASNCFQCHGTMGVGGFDRIRGDAGEVDEYLGKTANTDIMAAHAQGYTQAQLQAIVNYLNKN